MNKYCSNCGSELKENALFCTECGNRISEELENISAPSNDNIEIIENEPAEQNAEQSPETEIVSEKPKKKPLFKILCAAAALVILISMIFSSIADSKAKKIEEMHPNFYDVKVICSETFSNKELGDSLEYLLYNYKTTNSGGKSAYGITLADFEKGTEYSIGLENPLYTLEMYILIQCDEATNKKIFYEMKPYLEEHGPDYFDDMKNASDFLRKITGHDGIIPTDEARQIMIDNLNFMFNPDFLKKLTEKEDYRILFERGTALTKAIAYKSTESVYNWDYPEEYLGTMDPDTKSAFQYMFGDAYTTKTIWRFSKIDEETGSTQDFTNSRSTLEDIKKDLDVCEIGDPE